MWLGDILVIVEIRYGVFWERSVRILVIVFWVYDVVIIELMKRLVFSIEWCVELEKFVYFMRWYKFWLVGVIRLKYGWV